MTPDDFVQRLQQCRATAILRTQHEDAAAPAAEAAIAAGFRIIEFTLTVPGAIDRIREFAERPDIIVGAGTVLTADDAQRAVDAGARYLVSPVFDQDVLLAAQRLGVAFMPGTFTATEMVTAHRAGAHLLKLFPGPEGGPKYVRSLLAPLPFLKIVPTNGVHLNNAAAYLKAGAFALGFTTALFDPLDLASGDFGRVEERGRKLLAEIARWTAG